ncbi:coxsackievirus and adenovirus receptor homolog [Etheostoma cragini]|uniref:coxsackievirus and adenovirus receptor homolog n=1 Tax=Etheostoma cragini TaxID=417921 RepID=UPI00155E7BA0|nr:coxsackievirus and adenovirus receptor homolog [Etheostoma cragini]
MLSSTVLCLLLLLLLSASAETLAVTPGQDAALGCQALEDGPVSLLEWTREDLHDTGYVFFYRNQRAYERYQHPRYRGRVELRDPDMKHGDASVVLKDVGVNDTGTYDCRVIIAGDNEMPSSETRRLVNLTVTEPDPPAGPEAGDTGLVVGGAVAGVLLLLLLLSVLGVVLCKRRGGPGKSRPYEPPAPDTNEET